MRVAGHARQPPWRDERGEEYASIASYAIWVQARKELFSCDIGHEGGGRVMEAVVESRVSKAARQ